MRMSAYSMGTICAVTAAIMRSDGMLVSGSMPSLMIHMLCCSFRGARRRISQETAGVLVFVRKGGSKRMVDISQPQLYR